MEIESRIEYGSVVSRNPRGGPDYRAGLSMLATKGMAHAMGPLP